MRHRPELEDFGTGHGAAADINAATRRAGWDAGFVAGQQDGAAQAGQAQADASVALCQAITELGFGYHEAREIIAKEFAEVLKACVEALLPELARQALAPHIDAALAELVATTEATTLELRVHPEMMAIASGAVDRANVDLVAREASELGRLEVEVRCSTAARRIDLSEALTSIDAALAEFIHSLKETADVRA